MTTENKSRAVATTDDVKTMLAGSAAVAGLREETAIEIARAQSQAQLLTKQGAQWVKDATPVQLEAFARACVGLGLNPLVGEAYLIHGGFYVGIQGRRKRAQETGAHRGESAPRLLTPEEKEIHGVKEGDVARIVEVWREGMRLPGFGVGIVRKGEIVEASAKKGRDGIPYSPLGRDPEGMAAKRAASKAYRIAFADIDLPTADVDGHGASARVIDAESGEVLAAANRQIPSKFEEAREREQDERAEPADETPPAQPPRGPTMRERVKLAAAIAAEAPEPNDDELLVIFGGVPLETLEAECGITGKEAENIAAAVWSLAFPGGDDASFEEHLARAASVVHNTRAEAGQTFVPDAIMEGEPDPEEPEAEAEPASNDEPPHPAQPRLGN